MAKKKTGSGTRNKFKSIEESVIGKGKQTLSKGKKAVKAIGKRGRAPIGKRGRK